MNIFDWLNKAFSNNEPKDAMEIAVKERFNPTSTLYTTTMLMLAELFKTQEEMLARSEKMQLAKRAEALGFTNSYAVAEQKQFGKNVELLRFMVEMWRDLGRNTMLIGLDQFRSLLHRHDLMCVPFDAYKGDIPTKNLQEIENAVATLSGLNVEQQSRYAHNLSSRATVARSSNELLDMIRFPFYFVGDSKHLRNGSTALVIPFDFSPLPQGTMFIAAPKDFVEKPTVKQAVDSHRIYNIEHYPTLYAEERLKYETEVNLANRILRGVQGYANVTYSTAPEPLPLNYDPFVCSICDHGVIIHSMWGAEAEDATIKRYEQLRDAIIGNSKSLTV
mgnify:CR=1 FL=1